MLLTFKYSNGYLCSVTDCETKLGQQFEYDASGRVTKASQGTVRYSQSSLGAQDSAGNAVTLGTTALASSAETYKELKHNAYTYDFSQGDGISVETDVTNENGIKLAYFVDRNACITSVFEKRGDALRTLTKQGAKGIKKFAPNTGSSINGGYTKTTSGVTALTGITDFDIARSKAEESLTRFNYSIWLKTLLGVNYDVLEAELTYTFSNGHSDVSKVQINNLAHKAWQKVSFPVTVPKDENDKPLTKGLTSVSLRLLGARYSVTLYDNYEMAEIGFEPAPHSELQLDFGRQYTPLAEVNTVKYNGSSGPVTSNLYFTESDVIATFTNKYYNEGQQYFDVICNNNTKRIKVTDVAFGLPTGEWTTETKSPFRFVTAQPNGNNVKTYYGFNLNRHNISRGIIIDTVADVDPEQNTTSSTVVITDYSGNKKYEQDEYGVQTIYYYTDYGDLLWTMVKSSDDSLGAQEIRFYDNDGKLVGMQDNVAGQQLSYCDCGQVKSVEELAKSNDSSYLTEHRVNNVYDVFHDKALSVTEYDKTSTVASNAITYKDGRIRTVSDGTVKYGVKYDDANKTVEYTQFDGSSETTLQKDTVSGFVSNVQTHKSEYFDNNVLRAYTAVEVDKYGKPCKTVRWDSKDGGKEEIVYEYDNSTDSRFAAKPRKTVNDDGTYTSYSYDNDGNLANVAQCYPADSEGLSKVICGITKISENMTRYLFENNNVYYTSLVTDTSKALSPRITDVKNMQEDNYDLTEIPVFCQSYSYDKYGRLAGRNNSRHYTCDYGYSDTTGLLTSYRYCNYMLYYPYNAQSGGVDVKLNEDLAYHPNGELKKIQQNYVCNINSNLSSSGSIVKEYEYDNAHRLTKDTCTTTIGSATKKSTKTYTYRNDGRVSQIKTLDGTGNTLETKTFYYDTQGRLSDTNNGGMSYMYSYDNYGNRTEEGKSYDKIRYEYKYGGLLSKVSKGESTIEYGYNAGGIRSKKKVGNVETKFYTDGNKILGEKGKYSLIYFYGKDGLVGFKKGSEKYTYVLDSQGNVAMLFTVDGNHAAARYEYDAYGNCTVYDGKGNVRTDDDFIGNINPFRWKSFYYDNETGLYYANGSYYDPKTGLYLNALSVKETLNGAYLTRSLDRHGLMCNNVIDFANKRSFETNELEQMSLVSNEILNALPSLPQWLAISTSALSNTLSFSVYVRTAWYMRTYPEIIPLMKYDNVALLPGKYTKAVNVLSYVFVAVDTIYDIYDNIQQGKSAEYVIASAAYTAITGAFTVWASGAVGAAVGAAFAGFPGAIFGGILGLLVGVGLSMFFNWLKGEIFK